MAANGASDGLTRIPGYQWIVLQEGMCGGRPTIIHTRLEPRHLVGLGSAEQIAAIHKHITHKQAAEALRYAREHPECLREP